MKNFLLISTFLSLSLISLPVQSQELGGDIIGKAIRMDQMERRLMLLEQKLFSGAAKQVAISASTKSVDVSSDVRMMMADFEARIQQLEEEWRKMYGAVEDLGHSVDKLASKVELITKDLDFRLQDLETAAENTPKKSTKRKKKKEPEALASKKNTNKKQKEETIPKNISAEDLYKKSYKYLTATSYKKAEKYFKEFIKRHKDNKLADNAYYWLGEVYLVQGMAEKAVVEFSNGLGAFPSGTKAPANLLKMGVAFTQMDRKDHAKSAWGKLLRDFPNTPEAAKARKKLDAKPK